MIKPLGLLEVTSIKRGAEISLPGPINILPPQLLFPLPFVSSALPLYGLGKLDCLGVLCGEVSDPGFFHWSKAQALVVSLQHSRHGLLGPAPIRAQPRPRVPAVPDHHLIAGA